MIEIYYGKKQYKDKKNRKWFLTTLIAGGTLGTLIVLGCLIVLTNPMLFQIFGVLAITILRTTFLLAFGILSLLLTIGLVFMNAGLPLHRKITKNFVITIISLLILVVLFDFILYQVFQVHILSASVSNPVFLGITIILQVTVAISILFMALILCIYLTYRAIGIGGTSGLNEKIVITVISISILFVLDSVYITYYGFPLITKILGAIPL
jgi:hypothetical protein